VSTNRRIRHTMISTRARAIFKSTSVTLIDWARLADQFPMYREAISRKRHDQSALARIQSKGLALVGKVA